LHWEVGEGNELGVVEAVAADVLAGAQDLFRLSYTAA
jgi:hypothetical protein